MEELGWVSYYNTAVTRMFTVIFEALKNYIIVSFSILWGIWTFVVGDSFEYWMKLLKINSFLTTIFNVVSFYPVTCFLITSILYLGQSQWFSLVFSTNRRKTNRLFGKAHFAFRELVSLMFAFGLPALTGVYPWHNFFMKHSPGPVYATTILSFYFQAHIGFMLFKIIGNKFSFPIMIYEIIRSIHILLIGMVNLFWSAVNAPPPSGIIILLFYFDFVDVLENHKRGTMLEDNQNFVSWRIMGYVWLIFRFLLPIYGAYRNGYGWGLMLFIFGIILFFQLVLWLIIPTDNNRRKYRNLENENDVEDEIDGDLLNENDSDINEYDNSDE